MRTLLIFAMMATTAYADDSEAFVHFESTEVYVPETDTVQLPEEADIPLPEELAEAFPHMDGMAWNGIYPEGFEPVE